MIRYDPKYTYHWSLTGTLTGRITWPEDEDHTFDPNEFTVIRKWLIATFGLMSEYDTWMIMTTHYIITYTFYFKTEEDAVIFKLAWMDNVRFI